MPRKKMGGIDFHYPARQDLTELHGSRSFQALRPCVAASRTRALGTIVRPATSTMGSPVPAVTHETPALARTRTPVIRDVEVAVRITSDAGRWEVRERVPPGLSRLVHVAVEGALRVTSNTWPGVAEVREL